jgi:uncharacterized alkaline shock family protein YloU
MAQEYVVLKESGEMGRIAINKTVFQSIAEISLKDVEDIVPVESRFAKSVCVSIEDNKLKISADVRVKYGANAGTVSSQVQNHIYENILFMTGFKTSDITVNVVGFEI